MLSIGDSGGDGCGGGIGRESSGDSNKLVEVVWVSGGTGGYDDDNVVIVVVLVVVMAAVMQCW